jgi:hypothetical protein
MEQLHMNERIRELAEQAGFIPGIMGLNRFTYFDTEKFAKLIVHETLNEMGEQMFKFGDDQSNNPTWYKSMEAVKKHFGVKE